MESVSRSSSMLDPVRGLTVEAAQAASLSKALKSGSGSKSIPFAKLKALLDSRSDRDLLDGLRRVISMIYQKKPCLPYFSSVVKNVANPNIEVKKLVYIYLLHYAESDPDLALLSVNAIQKSLTDPNAQVRALALRTMAGMRVPVISQIVLLAIKRGTTDMSPHVRKAAALAIPKCYSLDPNTFPQLLEYLSTLLGDKQYFVTGPAVQAFLQICPDRMDLIHRHYRSLVRKLVDMDEWSQLATLMLLTQYSRRSFPFLTRAVTKTTRKGFYDDEPEETVETSELERVLEPDLELFLKACQNLLYSRNAAVITTVASIFLHIGTEDHLPSAIGPLISLLRSSPEAEHVALCQIVSIALEHPQMFVPYAGHFLVTESDSSETQKLKIELLTLVFPHSALNQQSLVLNELEHFCHSSSLEMVREAVQAIGRCAQASPSTSTRCFKVLLKQITSFESVLVSEVLTVLRHLIQQDPPSHRKTIVRLARNLDSTSSPQARSTIIWLVGEFTGLDSSSGKGAFGGTNIGIAPDVLRILAKGFADESEEVKGQIVLLAAKCYLLWLQQQDPGSASPNDEALEDVEQGSLISDAEKKPSFPPDTTHPIPKLWEYILLLCRYDVSYDLRDRARLFKNLLSDTTSTQLASLILLAPKPVPHAPAPSESRRGLMLGSTTLVLGKSVAGVNGLNGYEVLPEWVKEGLEPDSNLRDTDDGAGGTSTPGGGVDSRGVAKVAASQRLDAAVRTQGLERVVNVSRAGNKAKGGGEGKGKTLDDWLEESDDGEEDEEDEADEEEETEEETESEETDEEEESEEDEESEDEAQRKTLVS